MTKLANIGLRLLFIPALIVLLLLILFELIAWIPTGRKVGWVSDPFMDWAEAHGIAPTAP